MALNPTLANDWMRPVGGNPKIPRFRSPPHGGITAWFSMPLTALGEDREHVLDLNPEEALTAYETRDEH